MSAALLCLFLDQHRIVEELANNFHLALRLYDSNSVLYLVKAAISREFPLLLPYLNLSKISKQSYKVKASKDQALAVTN